MAEQEQKRKTTKERSTEVVEETDAGVVGARRAPQGRSGRAARRDRRGPRGQRRGVRPKLRAKGRGVVALPLFDPTTDPGPDFAALLQRRGGALPTAGEADLNLAHATTVRRTALRRRRRDGGRPARDRWQLHRAPRDGQGVPRRPIQRRRDLGLRGRRDRDGPPLPGATRALREGRGRGPLPRGQGQPAGPDGPVEPWHGDAGLRRDPPVLRLRPHARRRSHLRLRRRRRPLRGGRLLHDRLGRDLCAHDGPARLPRRAHSG